MFYENFEIGYVIKGVYRVRGGRETVTEIGRKHTALSYRIKGNSEIVSKETILPLRDGTVAFFPAGVDYVRITHGDEEYIVVHLDAFGRAENDVEVIANGRNVASIFETLLSEWERGSYNRCIRNLYRIFDKLAEDKKEIAILPQIIAPGVEYMKRCFKDGDLTVSQLAKLCHISDTYFRKVYREHFGISPVDALLNMRFEYAKDLLLSGYYQTKEVAIMSGFSDVKYFRTAFKKRFGITVGEYLGELIR